MEDDASANNVHQLSSMFRAIDSNVSSKITYVAVRLSQGNRVQWRLI